MQMGRSTAKLFQMRKQNLFNTIIIITVLFSIVSCSKWDDYKQYTASGETLYTGKLDSVKVFSGRMRVRLTGILPADPKIVKGKISWNDNRDSVVFPISKGGGIEVFDQTFAVDEGVKSFSIQTFDATGNGSVKSNTTGVVYGPRYESGLVNRPVKNAELLTTGNAQVTWDGFDTTSGAKGTWIIYTRTNTTTDSVFAPVSQAVTTLPGLKGGTSIRLRTQYLPTATAIDTFYSVFETKTIKADITSLYLSNTGPGFQRATFDGRWGTLAAPWITNAAAKNKGGINGGYSSDDGGVINWETWNNTPVVNGIVYQPTSAPLPAGSYTVSFDEYSEIQANSSVYCVAASGGNGIPVLADLSTALGSVALYNGAVTGTTGPSITDTRSFSFTLTSPQVVSIGFLANIAGNGNPGSYFQVKKIQLFSN
jgi:hypothetical protein